MSILQRLETKRSERHQKQLAELQQKAKLFAPVRGMLDALHDIGTHFEGNGRGKLRLHRPEHDAWRYAVHLSPSVELRLEVVLEFNGIPQDHRIKLELFGAAKPKMEFYPPECLDDLEEDLATLVAEYEVRE